jgi:hypothetical protein
MFGRRGAGDHEDSRADDRADANHDEVEGAERAMELMVALGDRIGLGE